MKSKTFMLQRNVRAALCALIAPLAALPAAYAQEDEEDDAKKEKPTIEKKTEGFSQSAGLFDFYTDPETGDLYMEIGEDDFGKEFIAFSYSENGVLEAGHFRGAYRDQRIISLNRHFNRIEFIEENTAFYFDRDNAVARAGDANISNAVLASIDIVARTPADDEESARYLLKINELFLSEALHQIKPSPDPEAKPEDFKVGSLAKSKTKVSELRNYPENVDVIVDYVFDNPHPINGGSDAVTDARNITVKVQHSFIAMPDEPFEPRFDDYRVGYFFDKVTDLTSHDAAPYRDMINRWRLEKKDPGAEISDPVEPIVWWIENTTPVEYRDVIRDASLAWNAAFEKAGFSNAIEVRVQPDDADWDAGDIRYNVLRWTSSPVPPFGGYGPSFTNPRTGEIIGADIMLEYSFITNRIVTDDVFETAGVAGAAPASLPPSASGRHSCSFSHHLQAQNLFGLTALQAAGATAEEIDALVREGIYFLILHEIGHTLGLNHNMKASILYGPREVHDAAVTQGAPVASVMDYPAVNIAPPGVEQGDYYISRPGSYDDWAIEFGYAPSLDDPAAEEARVSALLARSTERGHIFGNDADDMRAPGRGVNPQVMINDMSSDPVAYGVDRIRLVRETLPSLVEKFGDEESWQALRRGYLFATGQHSAMAAVISRQVGGVYVDRAAPGAENGAEAPFTPVPLAQQKAAMKALKDHVFAADAFDAPENLLRHLQQQRRGFNFFGDTEDPKLHDRALTIQKQALDHLLNPVVLQRMTDAQLYGGAYTPVAMIADLNDAVLGGDLTGAPNTYRRNLQIAYVESLAAIVDNPEYGSSARTAALYGVADVKKRLGLFDFWLPAETRAHRMKIKRILRGIEA